ncbi:MAG TPA: HIT domain-containing protein [Rhodobacterales bacterium]|nr:HIT domain-containing protein [Rhodobacterales bacterium]
MAYDYDSNNIFAKILRGEIPNDTVLETEHSLAFNDIGPQAPVHVLVLPKGAYVTWDHFISEATAEEVVDFTRAIHAVVEKLGLDPAGGGSGYRLIINAGPDGEQEVQHLHAHILGGAKIGKMVSG